MEEEEDEFTFQAPAPVGQSVAEGGSDCEKKPSELEVLLDDGQTNGSKPPADTEEETLE